MTVDRDRLVAALAPVVRSAGYDLEDVELSGPGRRTVLRIVVDRDSGFGLDDVADLSRDVAALLDDSDDLLPGAYVLEVSSPGVDRPLTLPRHWRRNVDRLVAVNVAEGEQLTGRIQSAEDDSAVLDVDGVRREVSYDQVALAIVQVELRSRGASRSADARSEAALDDAALDDLALDDEPTSALAPRIADGG